MMRFRWALACAAALLSLFFAQDMNAQNQQATPATPTFQINSNLVFLDVTVLDKNGHPVVTGLTKDDFTITEDKKPQRIFSFEAPQEHVTGPGAEDSNPEGKAPVTILVLDMLNTSFADIAYIRYEVKRFLLAQPERLASPAEMMVIRDQSLDMVQGYTRSRADLIDALDHIPAMLPFKYSLPSFFLERFGQSLDALQQISLQNRGIPGRKNVIWVGHGGPNINLQFDLAFSPQEITTVLRYVHNTTNLLVDSRISLFVIYPGLSASLQYSALEADADIGNTDPFAGDINFGMMVNETGGKLFYNRNDVDAEIARSEHMGAEYYTLTYQPRDVEPDGKFRRIRVRLRDSNLRAVTKAGYYAPDKNAPPRTREDAMAKLVEATLATIPFSALDLNLSGAVRHPDTRSAEFTVKLSSKNLTWLPVDDGKDAVTLTLEAASLNQYRSILASRVQKLTLEVSPENLARLPDVASHFRLTIRVPKKTRCIRVAIENEDGGRIGTAELGRKAIDAAPEAPTPEPQLAPQRPSDPATAKPASDRPQF
jgi:VWFA-related protein